MEWYQQSAGNRVVMPRSVMVSLLIVLSHAAAVCGLLYADVALVVDGPAVVLVALSGLRELRLHGFRHGAQAVAALVIGESPMVMYADGREVPLEAVISPVFTGPLAVVRLRTALRTSALVYWQHDLQEQLAWRLRRWLLQQA